MTRQYAYPYRRSSPKASSERNIKGRIARAVAACDLVASSKGRLSGIALLLEIDEAFDVGTETIGDSAQ